MLYPLHKKCEIFDCTLSVPHECPCQPTTITNGSTVGIKRDGFFTGGQDEICKLMSATCPADVICSVCIIELGRFGYHFCVDGSCILLLPPYDIEMCLHEFCINDRFIKRKIGTHLPV